MDILVQQLQKLMDEAKTEQERRDLMNQMAMTMGPVHPKLKADIDHYIKTGEYERV